MLVGSVRLHITCKSFKQYTLEHEPTKQMANFKQQIAGELTFQKPRVDTTVQYQKH